nr:uncharacterized protein LOC125423724 [Ziziphus jujuba var. spinosa]
MEEEKVLKDLPDKQIIINISEKLEDRSDWIIYKVPNKLREIHQEAYTPQLVSIGPFHHGKSSLKAMEHYKAKYMNDFLGRFRNHITMKELMDEFKKDECKLVKEIQRSYGGESFEPENKQEYSMDLIPMILQDACFILELFFKNHENNKNYRRDYTLSPWVEAAIKQDLILLENQIPFIVLTQLGDFRCPKDGKYLASIDTWPAVENYNEGCQWWKGRGCCWLNGCCWINCLELNTPVEGPRQTECIFRNVMALEQFSYPNEPRVCNYIFLLDQLIDTVEDVDLLVDKKIIENWLGTNKAVADLVNKLCDQIVTPRFLYAKICEKLNEHHEKRLNVARSTLKRVYFKDIWTGSGTVVGLVFLVFSLFSTYSTIKNLFFV